MNWLGKPLERPEEYQKNDHLTHYGDHEQVVKLLKDSVVIWETRHVNT